MCPTVNGCHERTVLGIPDGYGVGGEKRAVM